MVNTRKTKKTKKKQNTPKPKPTNIASKWDRWYNYIDPSGNMPNKRKYLKRKLIRRIRKKRELPLLKTLRKFGLVDFVKKYGDSDMKHELKKRMDLEKYLYADPEPYKFPDGRIAMESITNFHELPERAILPPRQPIIPEQDDYTFDDFETDMGITEQPPKENVVIEVSELPKKTKKKQQKITLGKKQQNKYSI